MSQDVEGMDEHDENAVVLVFDVGLFEGVAAATRVFFACKGAKHFFGAKRAVASVRDGKTARNHAAEGDLEDVDEDNVHNETDNEITFLN